MVIARIEALIARQGMKEALKEPMSIAMQELTLF